MKKRHQAGKKIAAWPYGIEPVYDGGPGRAGGICSRRAE